MGSQLLSPLWIGVLVVAVAAPLLFLVVRVIANRVRDRRTQAIIDASNRDGPVPDLAPDVEIPEVISKKNRIPLRRRFR